MHGRGRKRISEYQVRLLEKQKLRHIYGVGERQMRSYYERASRKSAVTGEELIRQLETRLDAVILRLGFALTQRQARQLVSHGHVKLNGRRLDVPSAQVKPEDTIELSDKAKNFVYVREAIELSPTRPRTCTATSTSSRARCPVCPSATRSRSPFRSKSG